MQVPVAIALYFGGSIAMHLFQQDAIVSAVRLCALCYLPKVAQALAAPCPAAMHTMQDANGCLWCVQLVQTYTRGMLPGLWPYIWSCVIMKVCSHIECSS